MKSLRNRPARRAPAGFTLVEAVISVLLVGLLMVASLQSFGASKRREIDVSARVIAQQLASAMMNEILLQTYIEPDANANAVFGLETGESTGNRSLFDDVDDYHGWSSVPPTERNGTTIPGLTGWTQIVNVVYADRITLESTAATNTGLKKITVTVSKNGKTLATLVGYRSIAWVDTIPAPSDPTGNHAPTAVATSPDLTRSVGQVVTFSASTSSDVDGDYLSYVWNFGDGATTSGSSVTHTYASPGNYTVTVTVYDGRGGCASSSLTAVISP